MNTFSQSECRQVDSQIDSFQTYDAWSYSIR